MPQLGAYPRDPATNWPNAAGTWSYRTLMRCWQAYTHAVPLLGSLYLMFGLQLYLELFAGRQNADAAAPAVRNAQALISWETAHTFRWEPVLIRAADAWHFPLLLWYLLYAAANSVLVLLWALYTYCRHPRAFALLRESFLYLSVVVLLIDRQWPLAPPRLVPGAAPGMQRDVLLAVNAHIHYQLYTAMPSVHAAWAILLAASVAATIQSVPIRLCALLYPALIALDIIVTANHYLLDVFFAWLFAVPCLLAAVARPPLRTFLPFCKKRSGPVRNHEPTPPPSR